MGADVGAVMSRYGSVSGTRSFENLHTGAREGSPRLQGFCYDQLGSQALFIPGRFSADSTVLLKYKRTTRPWKSNPLQVEPIGMDRGCKWIPVQAGPLGC